MSPSTSDHENATGASVAVWLDEEIVWVGGFGSADSAGDRRPDEDTLFMIGSDTWISERWASYGDIIAGYRAWLDQLPPKVAAQIANGNARALFAKK